MLKFRHSTMNPFRRIQKHMLDVKSGLYLYTHVHYLYNIINHKLTSGSFKFWQTTPAAVNMKDEVCSKFSLYLSLLV